MGDVVADWSVLAAGTFETTRLLLHLDELTAVTRSLNATRWVDTSTSISRSRPGTLSR
jgi:hypothetical protein